MDNLEELDRFLEKFDFSRLNKEEIEIMNNRIQFSSVQSLSHVRLFATPGIAACQASLSITNSRSSSRLMSIESVMPSSHLILCRPLLLLPSIPPSIRVFSNESTLCMRWPQSCPTLCDPIDGSPPGSPVHGILQARTLEWVAISFSNA